MSDIAIRVENLSKLYRIGVRTKYPSLRDAIVDGTRSSLRGLPSLFRRSATSRDGVGRDDYVWALKDVSLEVTRGEVLGIIGHNGAGKTTLLKILSRITEPTEGCAEIHGRVGSLLEVGTGFHPELTGRENIYLNGAILGIKRAEIQRRFDEIVQFSGVDKFIDTPVKRYSSGMYVRLAFAVAAYLDCDILLVDEVLAVGDAEFRKRCLGKMDDVARSGRTVLFVSHNMGAVQRLCKRVIRLDAGAIVACGEAREVVSDYLDAAARGFIASGLESEDLRIDWVAIRDAGAKSKSTFTPGDDLCIEIHYYAKHPIRRPYFWLGVSGQYGLVFGANMMFDGHRPERIEGAGTLMCTFRQIPLLPQSYTVALGVRGEDAITRLVRPAEVAFFSVQGSASSLGLEEENADAMMWHSAPVFIAYEWRMPDGEVVPVIPSWVGGDGHASGVGR